MNYAKKNYTESAHKLFSMYPQGLIVKVHKLSSNGQVNIK